MSDLLNATLGAVGQVGEAVDKVTGGRALRGALAGKPRELASVIPFSDTMGLTDHKDATSGRDLTDSYGLTTKGSDSLGSHAAGFLADAVLSPGNLVGGYGAFKAAPTLAKGLVAGGKALTGLDIVDHIGAGAKALGGKLSRHVEMPDGSLVHAFGTLASDDDIRRAAGAGTGFARDETAAIKAPYIPAKPVDLDAMRAESLSANATRPRRWSTDPAERQWYSGERGRRYAQRMSGKPVSNGVPEGIPEFSLGDAFRRFAGDESGSLKLPFDGVPHPPSGLARSDPDWVNNRTFYHGTSTPGLDPGLLDPKKTSLDNLFGRGVYTSDEGGRPGTAITTGYANAASRKTGMPPLVYQAQSDFKKILDLEQPNDEAVRFLHSLHNGTAKRIGQLENRKTLSEDQRRLLSQISMWPISAKPHEFATPEKLYQGLVRASQDAEKAGGLFPGVGGFPKPDPLSGTSLSDALVGGIRGLGYDAVTHTGGLRTQAGAAIGPHQVVIGLDPNDAMGVGRSTPYKAWEMLKNFGRDESGYLKIPIPGVEPGLADAMDGLGPMYPGGQQKFLDMAAGIKRSDIPTNMTPGEVQDRLKALARFNPEATQLAGELPEGSSFLGVGSEGLAFRTPEGSVVRIGDRIGQADRPEIPHMLQAFREAQIGKYKVEHLPMVNPLHDAFRNPLKEAGRRAGGIPEGAADAVGASDLMQSLNGEMASHMRDDIGRLGYNPWDVTSWNTGLTPEGKAVVYDGGAVKAGEGRPIAPKPTYPSPEGDLLSRAMAAGGPEKVRESLRQGLALGTQGQGVDVPQLPELIRQRQAVQDFLRSQGIEAGGHVASPAGPAAGLNPDVFSTEGATPSLKKSLAVLGASAAGGTLLGGYLSNRGQ